MNAGIVLGTAEAIPLRHSSVACVVTSPPYWDHSTFNDRRMRLPSETERRG
jgi:hypothetical protein